ncbi:pentapeptide repeat protein [Neisseria sp. oral taxon 014 str. F0314]|jgi:pentapeptide repeat family protein|uniref:Pentapeptide repeat-containing protein n=1 Tax=Neisseria oralis TaxID=1107316 RepID=A0ABW8Q3U2_9NEIS|nr:pentapeptide repeat-containing protein [Neisseria sp. oral taxon 014]EFI24100.1 pentapeptide repeat protein [Neisseria sp. oral taxon 014 str. F0314]
MEFDENLLLMPDMKLLFQLEKNPELVDISLSLENYNFHRLDLTNKSISNLKFYNCSLRGAFLSNSVFTDCIFNFCSLVTAPAENSKFIKCYFINSDLRFIQANYCNFVGSVFANCNLIGADFSNSKFHNSNFEENLFSKIASYNEETQYIEAKFENVIFNGKIVDKFNDI